MINYYYGLHRKELLVSKFDVNSIFYNLGDEMSDVYAALLGCKRLVIHEADLVTKIPNEDVIFYIKNTTESEFLVDYGLSILNRRVSEGSHPTIVSSSCSKVIEGPVKDDLVHLKGSASMPYMCDDEEKYSKTDFPIICLDPAIKRDIFLNSISRVPQTCLTKLSGPESIKQILENAGLLGTRLVEQRLDSLISIFEPNMTTSAFAHIVLLTRDIYMTLHRTGSNSQTSTCGESTKQSQESSNTSSASSKPVSHSSSKASQFSARSEALSLDYSLKLNRSKNRDTSLAIGLYIKLNNRTDVLKDKLSTALISNLFTSVRRTLFDRLWERITSHVTYQVNSFFYFQDERWNMADTKCM